MTTELKSLCNVVSFIYQLFVPHFDMYLFALKARFKHRILHAPNRIAGLSACKMRLLDQFNATYFNLMRVSRIFE